jgi:hypothetical protein
MSFEQISEFLSAKPQASPVEYKNRFIGKWSEPEHLTLGASVPRPN